MHITKMSLTVKALQQPNLNNGYFENYQLLGDSQFVRFCVEILDLESTFDEKRHAQVGFCISGQDSTQLAELVTENYNYLTNNLIIMIGTNDVKKRVDENIFKKAIYCLKTILKSKQIVWLTIPPIPKFQKSELYVKKLNNFNEEIYNLNGNNIKILHSNSLYMYENKTTKYFYFEEYYLSRKQIQRADNLGTSLTSSNRRDDIHLNRRGLIRLCIWLCINLLPNKFNIIQHYRERKSSQDIQSEIFKEYICLSSSLDNSLLKREELYSYIFGSSSSPPVNRDSFC